MLLMDSTSAQCFQAVPRYLHCQQLREPWVACGVLTCTMDIEVNGWPSAFLGDGSHCQQGRTRIYHEKLQSWSIVTIENQNDNCMILQFCINVRKKVKQWLWTMPCTLAFLLELIIIANKVSTRINISMLISYNSPWIWQVCGWWGWWLSPYAIVYMLKPPCKGIPHSLFKLNTLEHMFESEYQDSLAYFFIGFLPKCIPWFPENLLSHLLNKRGLKPTRLLQCFKRPFLVQVLKRTHWKTWGGYKLPMSCRTRNRSNGFCEVRRSFNLRRPARTARV